MKQFICPICMENRDLRFDKHGKPYIVCDPCGVQLFIRGKDGIRKLESLLVQNEDYKGLGPESK